MIENVCNVFLGGPKLDPKKLVGFGSDGAPVMVGEHHGVGVELERRLDMLWKMLRLHCVSHCVALGGKAGADSSPLARETDAMLKIIGSDFKKSAVKTHELQQIQASFGGGDGVKTHAYQIKLRQLYSHCTWCAG